MSTVYEFVLIKLKKRMRCLVGEDTGLKFIMR